MNLAILLHSGAFFVLDGPRNTAFLKPANFEAGPHIVICV